MTLFFIELGRFLWVSIVERWCSYRKWFRSARAKWQWRRMFC